MTAPPASTEAPVPRHLAVIMDGNGRWARQRKRPRIIGHRAGARAVNTCIDFCLERGIRALTLFAFSSENWGRPQEEVGALMKLFMGALEREVDELHRRGVRMRFIGERERFSASIRERMQAAEAQTASNTLLDLVIAARVVGGIDDALAPIARFGSDHTEVIVTEDAATADAFVRGTRSSAVMVNASSRFNDGGQLGLGAEIGISTTRLHAYGPMGVESLTIERFVVRGAGQVRHPR